VGLICVFFEIKINLSVYWGERFATYFVDPNTLGSQSFVLGILSFLMIGLGRGDSKILPLLQALGGTLGLYISIGSGSRGAWLTLPFLLILMLSLRVGDISLADQTKKSQMRIQTIAIFMSILAALFIGFLYSEKLSLRVINGYFEIHQWFSGTNLDTSAGTRLSIWKFSFQFANESLLFGYGEEKNMMQVLQGSPLNILANETAINTMALTGPHSDILSKLLSAGLFGLIAYLSLLFVPFYIFWIHRNELNSSKKMASRMGLYYIVGVFIAGLSNEQLSLKYLCTFYGLMIATLLAQVLYESTTRNHNPSRG
jgi:O-antigen ligase